MSILDEEIRLWLENKNIVDENFEPTKEKYVEIPNFYIDSLENGNDAESFINKLEKIC